MVLCFVDPEGGALQATAFLFPGRKIRTLSSWTFWAPAPVTHCCHFQELLASFVFLYQKGPAADSDKFSRATEMEVS